MKSKKGKPVKEESQRAPTGSTLRQRLLNGLIIGLMLGGYNFAKFRLEDKCSIIECERADWSAIRALMIENTTSNRVVYYPEELDVYPEMADDGTIEYLFIRVIYVSEEQTLVSDKLDYVAREMTFDDRNLWVENDEIQSFWTPALPPGESLERLKRASIDPDTAILLTKDLASKELGSNVKSISMELNMDGARFDVDSTWRIRYRGTNNDDILYWLDAETGKILDVEYRTSSD